MKSKLHPLLPLLYGAIFPLAFAPVNWPIVALISPFLLLWHTREQTPKQAFRSGYLWGLAAFAVGLSWIHIAIHDIGGAPFWLSALLTLGGASILGLINGTLFWFLNRYFVHDAARALIFAPAWVFIEWVREWILSGFPWLFIGYSQTDTLFATLAPIGSVYLISLTLAALIALVWFLLRRFPQQALRIAMLSAIGIQILLLLPPYLPQAHDESRNSGAAFNAALIQPDISQRLRWQPEQLQRIAEQYQQMTMSVADQTDLIIWPEGAIPVMQRYLKDYYAELAAQLKAHNSSLIVGGFTEDGEGRIYNSAYGFGQVQGVYSKRHLVPFGEYVPFESLLRGLLEFFNLPMSGMSPGAADETIRFRDHPVLMAICYETTYPQLVRENFNALQESPGWLLTISNDGWYGDSWGPKQHLQIARMRAQELALPVLRVTPTGLTVAIDADGRVRAALPAFAPGILKTTLQPREADTIWRRFGLLPVLLAGVLLASFAIAAERLKSRV